MSTLIIHVERASALIYALAKAGPKGVWLLPANVCPAVPLALMQAKCPFVFVDIDPKTLCMDVKQATQTIGQSFAVAGLIYVRTYGYAPQAEMDLPALRAALPLGAVLVDDQCLGTPNIDLAELDPHGADAVIFSTGYGKVLDLGGGGFGAFFNDLPYELPPPISEAEAQEAEAALNARIMVAKATGSTLFPDPQSETLPNWIRGKLITFWTEHHVRIIDELPARQAHRDAINRIYTDGLSDLEGLVPLVPSDPVWRFNLRASRRDEFLAHIFKNGLFASAHYYPASALFGSIECPVAKDLHSNILNLFNDQHFSTKQAKRIVSLARDFYSPAQ